MGDFETGAEVQDVAEPAETGVEEREVAEPVDDKEIDTAGNEPEGGKTDQDTAFAELQRAKEEAEARAEEAEKEARQFRTYRGLLSQVSDSETPELDIVAEHLGLTPEELAETLEEETQLSQLEERNEQLQRELEDIQIQKAMAEDLRVIQGIDPSVKSLDDLGEFYYKCVAASMTPMEAYDAVKARENRTTSTPPGEIGKVNQAAVEKDFYTMDEIKAMSPEEVRKNYKKVRESMDKISKGR